MYAVRGGVLRETISLRPSIQVQKCKSGKGSGQVQNVSKVCTWACGVQAKCTEYNCSKVGTKRGSAERCAVVQEVEELKVVAESVAGRINISHLEGGRQKQV